MVKQRYCLVVDNSQAVDTKGAVVQLNFQPQIDLDMDKNYALTVSEVDVTYINPNFVNGNVGFSYVYTTPSNLSTQVPQGYVMRSIYNATLPSVTTAITTAMHESTYFNYMGIVSNGTAPTLNIGSLSITGSTQTGQLSDLVNVNPSGDLTFATMGTMSSITINKGITLTESSGSAGVSLNYTASFNSTGSIAGNSYANAFRPIHQVQQLTQPFIPSISITMYQPLVRFSSTLG